ncbi:MAG: 3-dehydroquinate synthase, partial [Elstera sp.]
MSALASVDAPLRLSVALGDRAYPILIGSGLLDRAGTWIAPLLKGRTRVVVITDSNVGPLHLPRLVTGLQASGLTVDTVTVAAGEGSKSWAGIEALVDRLLELRVDRGTLLL